VTPSRGSGRVDGARRARTKGDRNEQAILDTAALLLSERPLASIGIDEMAHGAQISRSTFYFYFESRDAVLRALAARIASELVEASSLWPRVVEESSADAARRALHASLKVWRRHGPVLRATLAAREADPQMREFWEDMGRSFVNGAAAEVERLRAARGLAADPTGSRRLAGVLVGMNREALYTASTTAANARRDRELVDTLVTVWMRAVG
jgi:AcrR family transcriptional regulator